MKGTRCCILSLALAACLPLAPRAAVAGVYTDDLTKCLVAKTTEAGKGTLITWMFAAIALNPAVAPMASVSPAQRTKINSDMARLFESLMTDTCRTEAQAAVKYEGSSAIEASFSVLGQVAGRELFANPDVFKGMGELESLIDTKKLEAVFGNAK